MKGAGQPRGNLPACTATSEESLCLTQKLHPTEVRVNPNPRCFLRQLLQHPPHQGSFLSDANSLTLCLLNLGCKGKAADIHNTSSAENLGHWWFHPAFPAQMHPNAPFQREIRAAQVKLKDLDGWICSSHSPKALCFTWEAAWCPQTNPVSLQRTKASTGREHGGIMELCSCIFLNC